MVVSKIKTAGFTGVLSRNFSTASFFFWSLQ